MPRQPSHVTLKFPILGLNKNFAKREQPENTTIDCSNVRGYGYTDRARGGQRPGLSRFTTAMNGSNRIHALTAIITTPTALPVSNVMNVRSLKLVCTANEQIRFIDIADGAAPYGPQTPTISTTATNSLTTVSGSPYIATCNMFNKVYFSNGKYSRYFDGTNDTTYDWFSKASTIADDTGTFPHQAINSVTGITAVTAGAATYVVTVTKVGHGFSTGNVVTIYGTDNETFEGSFGVTVTGPDTFTYVSSAASGTVSSGTAVHAYTPRLIATWRGRVVAAGLPGADAHNWFMSSVGDPNNWDYSPTSLVETQAVAGNSSNAGKVGEVIQAIVPMNDDILIFGCDSSIWQLTGDPMVGGRFDLVSDTVGMAFGDSWAKDNVGNLYFFGSRGQVYRLPTGGGITNLTATRLPDDFDAIDLNTHRVELAWDDEVQGLYVFVQPLAKTTAGYAYFYSARLDAWYKDTYTTSKNPTTVHVIDGDDPDDRKLLVGCEDGVIRFFDEDSTFDEDVTWSETATGSAISSYVVFGPYRVEGGDIPFIFSEIQAVLDSASNNLDFKVYVGNSCENAHDVLTTDAATNFSGDFAATKSVTHYPRKRGYAAYVKLYNAETLETWAMEALRAKLLAIPTSLRRQSYG